MGAACTNYPDTGVLLDHPNRFRVGASRLAQRAGHGLQHRHGSAATANGLRLRPSVTAAGFGPRIASLGGSGPGDFSTALGYAAAASNTRTTAVGISSSASGLNATAVGNTASAGGNASVALGTSSNAAGLNSTALGGSARATADNATSLGQLAWATVAGGTAIGRDAYVYGAGINATAVGLSAWANGASSVALGAGSRATEANVVSVGNATGGTHPATRRIVNVSEGTAATDAATVGQLAGATEHTRYFAASGGTDSDTAAYVEGEYATASGESATATGEGASALGSGAFALADGATAVGFNAVADKTGTTAVGAGSAAVALDATAVGVGALAQASNSVALGQGSVADEDNTVSVGSEGNERQVTNVATGRVALGSTDAVNGGQVYDALDSAAQIIGGGSEVTAFGTLSAPAFMIQGSTYFSVGDAFGAVDAQISVLDGRLSALEGSSSTSAGQATAASAGRRLGDPASDVGTSSAIDDAGGTLGGTPQGPAVTANAVAIGDGAVATQPTSTAVGDGASATAANSVALGQGSVADRANTVSVGSAGNERQVTNVAAGTQATDAVNVAQLESTATQAVTTANAYTDQRFDAWSDSFTAYQGELERRFTDQDRRIDRQGAMGAAMLNMATSAAGIRTQNRVGVGLGFQGGESALSLGYQRAINDRATLTIGGAFSGDEKSVGVGAGFGW